MAARANATGVLLQLDAAHAEVGLGSRPHVGGPVRLVEFEDHPLTLPERPEDRALEGGGGEGVLGPVGVAHHGALTGSRVVRLDHALHGSIPPAQHLGAYHHAARPPNGTPEASLSGEFAFLERLRQALPELPAGQVGVGDDTAVLDGGLLFATDVLTEGIHFDLRWSTPADVGWKALAVTLSDVAAM